MREWIKELGKTLILMSLPIYGGILWFLLEWLNISYWYAWALTNIIYTPIIYGVNRFMVFRKRGENYVEV